MRATIRWAVCLAVAAVTATAVYAQCEILGAGSGEPAHVSTGREEGTDLPARVEPSTTAEIGGGAGEPALTFDEVERAAAEKAAREDFVRERVLREAWLPAP